MPLYLLTFSHKRDCSIFQLRLICMIKTGFFICNKYMISNQYIHLIVLSTVGFYIFEQITQQLEATFIMCNTYCYSHFYYWLHIFSSYSVNSFSRYAASNNYVSPFSPTRSHWWLYSIWYIGRHCRREWLSS